MNQALVQQQIESNVKLALGDLYLQLIAARASQTVLEQEVQDLKTKLAKHTVGSEAKEEKGND